MKLEEDLYGYPWIHPYENNCNTYLVRADRSLLIDPGHSRFLGLLIDQMQDDGISPETIDVVMITHAHPDHLEGVEFFLEKPVRITMSQEEERYLLENGKRLFDMMGRSPPKYRVDFYLKEGSLCLGQERFEVLETPGHSPGSLSIYWPRRKALFTGDVVFYGGIGRTDFAGGDPRLLMQSIERLSELETELLLPGHGEIVRGREAVVRNFRSIRQAFYAFL